MAKPTGFDYFLRLRPINDVGGKVDTVGKDYFLRGRPFPFIQGGTTSMIFLRRTAPQKNVLLRR